MSKEGDWSGTVAVREITRREALIISIRHAALHLVNSGSQAISHAIMPDFALNRLQ